MQHTDYSTVKTISRQYTRVHCCETQISAEITAVQLYKNITPADDLLNVK